MALSSNQQIHWRKNLRLTGVLLLISFVVTFGVSYVARKLSFSFLGLPLGLWMAAHGALAVYGLIIAFCVWAMLRLDGTHGVQERED